jgi:UDP-N-acetylmuramyl pentapeptide phosphotransferase/UDP-N-acetylglucosamine-1-phosphate transferase
VPLTVIATIGAINALNMIDGIDGLSGSLSIVSLLLIAVAVYLSGDAAYFSLVIVMAGGVAGFLYFNLRYLSRRRARCFLGDNGSMLLGFVFAWLLADLSQMNDGSPRAITPITTLWLFSVPLIDTLCVMLRRMWMGRSRSMPTAIICTIFSEGGFPCPGCGCGARLFAGMFRCYRIARNVCRRVKAIC